MSKIIDSIKNKLIVSCQAYEDTPLYGADYMQKMAMCAIMGGASGIRACWADNIKSIREITNLPIIGINKVIKKNFDPINDICITPDFESAAEVIEAGADILALDCTPRNRSYDDIYKLIQQIKKSYPGILIMADISTLEEGIESEKMGVDIVSTTLSGYTSYSRRKGDEPDYALVKELKSHVKVPVNAEGRIWEVGQLIKTLESGADMVTIGTAITRPNIITNRFVEALNKYYMK